MAGGDFAATADEKTKLGMNLVMNSVGDPQLMILMMNLVDDPQLMIVSLSLIVRRQLNSSPVSLIVDHHQNPYIYRLYPIR